VNLPNGKHVEIALTYIYGVGRSTANIVLTKVGIDKTRKIETLSEAELDKIRDELKTFLVE
jgi:small subunit ribosomal protein S13